MIASSTSGRQLTGEVVNTDGCDRTAVGKAMRMRSALPAILLMLVTLTGCQTPEWT